MRGIPSHARYTLPCLILLDPINILVENRLCAVETALSQVQASLSVRSSSDYQNRQEVNFSYIRGILAIQLTVYSRPPPSTIEQSARDAPMNLIQEIRQNITSYEQPTSSDDRAEDILTNSIVSVTLLKGKNALNNILLKHIPRLTLQVLEIIQPLVIHEYRPRSATHQITPPVWYLYSGRPPYHPILARVINSSSFISSYSWAAGPDTSFFHSLTRHNSVDVDFLRVGPTTNFGPSP